MALEDNIDCTVSHDSLFLTFFLFLLGPYAISYKILSLMVFLLVFIEFKLPFGMVDILYLTYLLPTIKDFSIFIIMTIFITIFWLSTQRKIPFLPPILLGYFLSSQL